ncbi:hypothetical protein JTB14_014450 [Gonioctena quinquepunctata]|nr:hypothetical protein JTB14_014450 [Gonioctena quinquepunctata]
MNSKKCSQFLTHRGRTNWNSGLSVKEQTTHLYKNKKCIHRWSSTQNSLDAITCVERDDKGFIQTKSETNRNSKTNEPTHQTTSDRRAKEMAGERNKRHRGNTKSGSSREKGHRDNTHTNYKMLKRRSNPSREESINKEVENRVQAKKSKLN